MALVITCKARPTLLYEVSVAALCALQLALPVLVSAGKIYCKGSM